MHSGTKRPRSTGHLHEADREHDTNQPVGMVSGNQDVEREATTAKKPLPPAPPLLKDADLAMIFTDKGGDRHVVEIRGARAIDGIYFRASDIARALERKDLLQLILHSDSLEENTDYVVFAVGEDGKPTTAELFLTARGLLTMCFSKMLCSSCLSGELFLAHLGNRVYKFGALPQLQERLAAHESKLSLFGSEHATLIYSVKIDADKLSIVLDNLSFYLEAFGWCSLHDDSCCVLTDNDLELAKRFFDRQQELHYSGGDSNNPKIDEMKLASMLFALLSPEGDAFAKKLSQRDHRIAQLQALVDFCP